MKNLSLLFCCTLLLALAGAPAARAEGSGGSSAWLDFTRAPDINSYLSSPSARVPAMNEIDDAGKVVSSIPAELWEAKDVARWQAQNAAMQSGLRPTQSPMTVYRWENGSASHLAPYASGDTFVNPRYVSTSTTAAGAEGYRDSVSMGEAAWGKMTTIRVPAGTPAYDVVKNLGRADQAEMTLGSGLTYRMLGPNEFEVVPPPLMLEGPKAATSLPAVTAMPAPSAAAAAEAASASVGARVLSSVKAVGGFGKTVAVGVAKSTVLKVAVLGTGIARISTGAVEEFGNSAGKSGATIDASKEVGRELLFPLPQIYDAMTSPGSGRANEIIRQAISGSGEPVDNCQY
jgi:hypothetical protein